MTEKFIITLAIVLSILGAVAYFIKQRKGAQMEAFIELLRTHTFEVIITGFFSILAWLARQGLMTYRKSVEAKEVQVQKESDEQLLIKQGLLALLRFRINRMCFKIKDQGYMSIDEKLDIQDLHTAYASLGGNSRTHLIYEEVMKKYEVKEGETEHGDFN